MTPPLPPPPPPAIAAIGAAGIVAVVRTDAPESAIALARAAVAAGIGAVEITFTVPDAVSVVAALAADADAAPDHPVVGAGTVRTVADLEAAAGAGARFVMSPTVDVDVVAAGERIGVPVVPGAMTPTEVGAALDAGAPAVKIFPAATVGTAHLSALRQVFPGARLVPTGGVEPDQVRQWRSAGAFALGIGGALDHAMRRGGPAAMRDLADGMARDWATGNTSPLGGGT